MSDYVDHVQTLLHSRSPGLTSVQPFMVAVRELGQLRQMALNFQQRGLTDVDAELAELFTHTEFGEDFQWYVHRVLNHTSPETVVVTAQLLGASQPGEQQLYVGPHQHWLLISSRNLGLIRLKALRQLRTLKVCSLGASVAASTVELLASLGCENIKIIDHGLIEPSNIPRLPMASIEKLGTPKVAALIDHLQQRYPYGKFIGVCGKVVAVASEKNDTNDQVINEFVAEADVILEVIDELRMKTVVHTETVQSGKPVFFIADVGVHPVIKKVQSVVDQVAQPFGRSWTPAERTVLERLKVELPCSPLTLQQAAYLMIGDELPGDHLMQFLLSCQGVMPYWSQTAITSKLSAAETLMQILDMLGGAKYQVSLEQQQHLTAVTKRLLQLSD